MSKEERPRKRKKRRYCIYHQHQQAPLRSIPHSDLIQEGDSCEGFLGVNERFCNGLFIYFWATGFGARKRRVLLSFSLRA